MVLTGKVQLSHMILQQAYPGIKIIGIDFHIGSQINEIKPFEESLDLLVGIIRRIKKKRP